ncbi:hypothetical protein ACN47E_000078 [Coniothyrium glycines]
MHAVSLFSLFFASATLAVPSSHQLQPRADQSVNTAHSDFLNYAVNINGVTVTATELTQFQDLAAGYQFAATASECDGWGCAGIIFKYKCISKAIKKRDWLGVIDCVDKETACDCASCVPGLGDFVQGVGVCEEEEGE